MKYSLLILLSLFMFTQSRAQRQEKFKIKVYCTNWGMSESWDSFCAKVKTAGFDGVESWLPGSEQELHAMQAALKKYDLSLGLLSGGGGSTYPEYLTSFTKNLEMALAMKPDYVNCHTGKDYYTMAENKKLIDAGTLLSEKYDIPVYHETHRGRFSFAAHVTKVFLQEIPKLTLALDISHWCNVHESLLGDQKETVALALKRTGHIHARVGHPQGPQVNDPMAPEWKSTLEQHLAWWDEVVRVRKESGQQVLTVTTEFGPAGYLPTLPYTQQPVASQWDINVAMLKLLKARYN